MTHVPFLDLYSAMLNMLFTNVSLSGIMQAFYDNKIASLIGKECTEALSLTLNFYLNIFCLHRS